MQVGSLAQSFAGAQVQHYFSDRLGSVMAVTNTSGQVLQHLIYTPFGVHLRGDATGQRHDPETGLHYRRARYYSADLGRFRSVDPVGHNTAVDRSNFIDHAVGSEFI